VVTGLCAVYHWLVCRLESATSMHAVDLINEVFFLFWVCDDYT